MSEEICLKCGYPIENTAGTCFRCNTGMPPDVPNEADEIERLREDRDHWRQAADLWMGGNLKLQAQLAVMREALEKISEGGGGYSLAQMARQALAPDAGKAAARVIYVAGLYVQGECTLSSLENALHDYRGDQ